MNFVDQLRGQKELEKEQIRQNVENCFTDFVQNAVRTSVTEAYRQGRKEVSGFVVSQSDYDTDTRYFLADWKDRPSQPYRNLCILRIDQLESGYALSIRYPQRHIPDNEEKAVLLSPEQTDQLLLLARKAIADLGFTDDRVEARPMKFYGSRQKVTLLGRPKWGKYSVEYEGIGKVLWIELHW